jgi:surface antigen
MHRLRRIVAWVADMAVGGAVDRSMDEQDRRKTAHTLETVRSGVPSQWRNADTGHVYRVAPTRIHQASTRPRTHQRSPTP